MWTVKGAAATSDAAAELSAELDSDLIRHIKTVTCAQLGHANAITRSDNVYSFTLGSKSGVKAKTEAPGYKHDMK